jgi:hypothetical protein
MHYKTIVLEMLRDRPTYHRRLCQLHMLLPTVERHARELKADREAWNRDLSRLNPELDPTLIGSLAMEHAVKELLDRLPTESSETEEDAPTNRLLEIRSLHLSSE